jgi:xanthine dehydrogenase accessory factor
MGIADERLGSVHMPIGLDIGGQLSVEIALAAVAEMQAVKYGRPGGIISIKHPHRGIVNRDELF